MFYQCVDDPEDQDFLHFLWFKGNDPTDPIVPCCMTCLSSGLGCAQSTAMFCLESTLLVNATDASYLTTEKELRIFYVDDGLFSFQSDNESITFFKEVVPLLALWGFLLTKFFMNSPNLKLSIPDKDLAAVKLLNFETDGYVQSTLGISWLSIQHCFKFNCNLLKKVMKS